MILAFDTFYFDKQAKTICIAFENWHAETYEVYSEIRTEIADYEPGAFYKRELPCILSLLRQISLETVTTIVVDGYVFLDDSGKPGLGSHLYRALEEKIPIIGVAKTRFASIEILQRVVYRGASKNPLYVTAIGLNPDEAAESIQNMQGDYRIPTLFRQLDSLTKDKI